MSDSEYLLMEQRGRDEILEGYDTPLDFTLLTIYEII
jgi:hypothetical protein